MADKMLIMKIQGKDIIKNDRGEVKLPIYRVPKRETNPIYYMKLR